MAERPGPLRRATVPAIDDPVSYPGHLHHHAQPLGTLEALDIVQMSRLLEIDVSHGPFQRQQCSPLIGARSPREVRLRHQHRLRPPVAGPDIRVNAITVLLLDFVLPDRAK
ncbi:MAG: hypothetical protein V3S24_07995 [Candidatus Tectomicrobia bacterium]